MTHATVWLLCASVALIAGMIIAVEYAQPACDSDCRARRARQWQTLDGR